MSTDWMPLLVSACLRASAILVAAYALTALMKRAAASTRHFVWTCAIGAAVLVTATIGIGPRWNIAVSPSLAPVASMVVLPEPVEPPATQTAPDRPSTAVVIEESAAGAARLAQTAAAGAAVRPASLVLGLWAFGAALVIAYALVGAFAAWWIRRTATPVRTPWADDAAVLAEAFEIRGPIAIVESAWASTPMVCGLWRPVIVMPRDAADWPEERLRMVVLHELAHIKRRDCVTQTMARLLCAFHWFNPLTWLAARRLRVERERACDDFVLTAGPKGSEYADHLLAIARAMRSTRLSPLAGAGLAMARRSQLEGRLMAILDPDVPRSSALAAKVAALIIVVAIAIPVAAVSLDAGAAAASAGDSAAALADSPLQAAPGPSREALPPALSPEAGLSRGPGSNGTSIVATPAPPQAVDAGPVSRLSAVLDVASASSPEAAAQAAATNPQALEALLGALSDGDADVRASVVEALSRMRDPRVTDALLPLLGDGDAEVREHVVEVLARSREPRVLAALAKLVNDNSADVREQVVEALGESQSAEWVPSLITALDDSDADVRETAVQALGELREPKAFDALVKALGDSSPDVREGAADALGQLGDPRAVDALMSALKDGSPDVREQAVQGLSDLRDPKALPALAAALRDSNADVREAAAEAIGQISGQ